MAEGGHELTTTRKIRRLLIEMMCDSSMSVEHGVDEDNYESFKCVRHLDYDRTATQHNTATLA
jgi:hypothetical protein